MALRMTRLTEEHGLWQKSSLERIKLTEREQELAELNIRGLSNREIADELFIAEETVHNYISNLYGKLEVVDRAQAIVRLQALICNQTKEGYFDGGQNQHPPIKIASFLCHPTD